MDKDTEEDKGTEIRDPVGMVMVDNTSVEGEEEV